MADLVETAQAASSFKTLVSATQAAGLVETLKGPGPFTLFAPTDDAFTKLPAGTLDTLLKDTQRLKELLTYHVAAALLAPADLLERRFIKTVQGQRLTVDASLDAVEIDEIFAPFVDDMEDEEEDIVIVVETEDEEEDIDLFVNDVLVTTLYERVMINGANVTQVIPADNGIIYALDAVLTPPKRRTHPATQGSPAS